MKYSKVHGVGVMAISLIAALLLGFSFTAASQPKDRDEATQALEQYRAERLARLRGEKLVCGTTVDGSVENRVLEEKLRHERNLQRLTQMPQPAMQAQGTPLRADIGDIAVIEDDGSLVVPADPFDLTGLTVQFTPAVAGGYEISSTSLTFDNDAGNKLTGFRGSADPENDGFVEVPFNAGFTFTYFGQTYNSLFVGTNGYVTFGRGDFNPDAMVSLFLIRPRIAAFWQDLDPSQVSSSSTAGIFVKQLADQVVVTYRNVPLLGGSQFNTFQITLTSTGQISLSYSRVGTRSALVGISPGRTTQQNVVDLSHPPQGALGDAIFELFHELTQADVLSVPQVFYQTHTDDFDFVYIWTDFRYDLGNAFAFFLGTRNDAQGIGRPVFNQASAFGSAGRLQGVLVLNDVTSAYPASPFSRFLRLNSALSVFGQEQGHRWLSYIRFPGSDPNLLLGRQRAHWNFFFNTESTSAFSSPGQPRSSSVEGNVWIDNGNGAFTTPGNELIDGYSLLDQYLMGFRAPEEVATGFVIAAPSRTISCFGEGPTACPPTASVSTSGTRVNVSIDQIIQANGQRIPTVQTSQKEFRVAFILLIQNGTTPSQAELDKLNLYRTAWEDYFNRATDNLAHLSTRLSSN